MEDRIVFHVKPELVDAIKKLEEQYEEALSLERSGIVQKPIAYALYKTWKEYNERVRK